MRTGWYYADGTEAPLTPTLLLRMVKAWCWRLWYRLAPPRPPRGGPYVPEEAARQVPQSVLPGDGPITCTVVSDIRLSPGGEVEHRNSAVRLVRGPRGKKKVVLVPIDQAMIGDPAVNLWDYILGELRAMEARGY